MYSDQFNSDLAEAVARCKADGVDRIFLPNIDLASIEPMLKLEESYPHTCFSMMGLHPCSVKEDFEKQLDHMEKLWNQRDFVAVGEIGIDLYWDKTFLAEQQEAFRRQIRWAKEKKRPIVIHCRESFEEIFQIVDELNDDSLSGIFHCFTGTTSQAKKIIEYGNFWLGIGGVLTFKNSGLDNVVKDIDLNHLVLETDSPYLAPAPFRGKRNESAYVKLVASKLADIKQIPIEEVARQTTDNSRQIFGV